jgi:NAD(P)-dependent dehydrogenase (short-subunit alcohol dehydrogenase family)
MPGQESKRIALVTGASHGIGLEVCRQLAEQGLAVILTARDLTKAQSAANQLTQAEPKLDIRSLALDLANEAVIKQASVELEKEFGKLDILVNNAAAYADWMELPSTADLSVARQVLETTLFGTWQVIQTLLPLLKKSEHGRIVNVSSGAGSHGDSQFGLATNRGATASYGIAKAALNALTTKFAAELAGTSLLVNAVCPGLTATAPGMEAMGARPIPEGAASIVWAALLPDAGPSGGFFRDGKPLPW